MSTLHGVIKSFHEGFRYFLISILIFILVKEILLYIGKSPLGAPLVQLDIFFNLSLIS